MIVKDTDMFLKYIIIYLELLFINVTVWCNITGYTNTHTHTQIVKGRKKNFLITKLIILSNFLNERASCLKSLPL